MKLEDLMLNDLVSFNGEPCKVARIAERLFLEKDGKVFYAPIEKVSPIPLTTAILEKSGFHYGHTASEEDFCGAVGCGYPEKGWCYDEGAGEIKIIFPNESDGGLIRLDDQCDNKHMEFVFGEPIMVHELQHNIRSCNITKDLIL